MIETLLFKIKAIIGAIVVSMTFSSPIVPPVVVQDGVQDIVQVVEVATSTATTTEKATSIVTITVNKKPVVVTKDINVPTKVEATTTQEAPVAPTQTLPSNTETVVSAPVYVPPTVQVVQVTAYVPQQEVANTPTPSQSMEQTYTIKKGNEVIHSSQTEAQVRSFASDLNNYINWKKKMQTNTLKEVVKALQANGYDVPEINTND